MIATWFGGGQGGSLVRERMGLPVPGRVGQLFGRAAWGCRGFFGPARVLPAVLSEALICCVNGRRNLTTVAGGTGKLAPSVSCFVGRGYADAAGSRSLSR